MGFSDRPFVTEEEMNVEAELDVAMASMSKEAWKADIQKRKWALSDAYYDLPYEQQTGAVAEKFQADMDEIYKEVEKYEKQHGYIGFC